MESNMSSSSSFESSSSSDDDEGRSPLRIASITLGMIFVAMIAGFTGYLKFRYNQNSRMESMYYEEESEGEINEENMPNSIDGNAPQQQEATVTTSIDTNQ